MKKFSLFVLLPSMFLLIFLWIPSLIPIQNEVSYLKHSIEDVVIESIEIEDTISYPISNYEPRVVVIKEESKKSSWKETVTFFIGGINILVLILVNLKKLFTKSARD